MLLRSVVRRNLDAFQQGSENILQHKLHVNGSRVVAVDGDLVPTGPFIDVEDTPFDFRVPKVIGTNWNATVGLCGGGIVQHRYSFGSV